MGEESLPTAVEVTETAPDPSVSGAVGARDRRNDERVAKKEGKGKSDAQTRKADSRKHHEKDLRSAIGLLSGDGGMYGSTAGGPQ